MMTDKWKFVSFL